jgi:hypothetical protein
MGTETPIFITGLYRSGTTLLSRAMNAHPKLSITFDNVHFMRFCYQKFNPLIEKNILNLLNEVSQRIFERSKIELDKKSILSELSTFEKIEYSHIYNIIMKNCFLHEPNKVIWGEKTNVAWGAIPDFLKMFPNGKCIFLLRDPRDVLCSFKRMTTNPWPGYLDAIFASLGAFQQALYLNKKYSKDNLKIIKYENFVNKPDKVLKDICSFVDIIYDQKMTNIQHYKDINGEKWISNTSYSKKITKISNESIGRWKKNILKEELCLLETILQEEMKQYGYELSEKKYSINDFLKSIEIIRASPTLVERFDLWLKEKRGIDTYPNNPSWQSITADNS